MTCHICNTPSSESFQVKVLFKYDVTYYRCHECGFIQTETPYWLPEAYESAITSLDIGLVSRNLHWAPTVEAVIRKWFRPEGPFLDYGGGYGLFVRMMRDRGFPFIRLDQYCENLFAKHFDVTDQPEVKNYELITAFEVFEHLANPVGTVEQMLQAGKSILFTTKVLPNPNVTPETWWYFIPETGQHVALYSLESLHRLAKRFGLQLYSDGHDLHLMTAKPISPTWLRWFTHPRKVAFYNYLHRYPAKSMLNDDFQKVYDSVRKQPLKDLI
ncbi:class I SAM-dependent methyltransferase [Larkinella terrae]|uniref:Methyltransferase domain-containing protein n=1 Tax=Larkinella terrae TaxID=2025311 RepID=A0A7K0EGK8_9BACT|nr:class I SAM-dependent methyltransferase [Larkinella terrae]MRS60578.1 methyltransferase domain-containing protein [Larkinella terrae]